MGHNNRVKVNMGDPAGNNLPKSGSGSTDIRRTSYSLGPVPGLLLVNAPRGSPAKRAGTRFNTRAVSTITETPLMIFVEAERRFSMNVGASSQQPRLYFYQEASCTQFGLGGVRAW